MEEKEFGSVNYFLVSNLKHSTQISFNTYNTEDRKNLMAFLSQGNSNPGKVV